MEDYYYPSRYSVSSKPATKYDYALLRLKDSVKDICQDDLIALNGELHSAKPVGVAKSRRIVEVSGENGNAFHKIYVLPGHSGSPIISYANNTQLSIIGICRGVESMQDR